MVPTRAVARASRRLQARAVIAVGDAASLAVSLTLADLWRNGKWLDIHVLKALPILVGLFLVVAINRGAFSHSVLERWHIGARRAISALLISALLLISLGFVMKVSSDFSRAVLLVGTAGSAALLIAFRWITGRIARRLLPAGVVDVVVLHDGGLVHSGHRGRTIDASAQGLTPLLDDPYMLDRIGRALRDCDRVIVAASPARRGAWSDALKGLGIEVEVVIPELEQMGVIQTGRFDGKVTGVIARGPLRMSDKILKRGFDLLASLFFLPALLLVTGIVALLIKFDDGGPLFFRQVRVGQGNRLFSVLKFRSMRAEQSDAHGNVSVARQDMRVTRVGNWLRRTSLDELPQLYNVLRGDMSIVGPRPHALGSTAGGSLFWEADGRYWHRHAVKPGLTGLAQVRGLRGATESESDLIDRVQADLEYVAGWSLWRDLRILASTARVMLHSNAY